MQNAHERFGSLEFIKRTKETTTRVRVHIDRAVLETPKDERGQASAHLIYARMTAEGRLRFAVWLQEAEKQNTRVLKNLMVKRGPIHYRDGNQGEYFADFVPVEKKFDPYRDAVSILDGWFSAHPDEQDLRDKLTVSGLSSALKAEKRAELAQKLAGVADVIFETELRIGRERGNGSKKHT